MNVGMCVILFEMFNFLFCVYSGWNGGSHSPHPKGTDSIPDSSSWPATEKQGWGEDKLSNPDHHFDSPSSATVSEIKQSLYDLAGVGVTITALVREPRNENVFIHCTCQSWL